MTESNCVVNFVSDLKQFMRDNNFMQEPIDLSQQELPILKDKYTDNEIEESCGKYLKDTILLESVIATQPRFNI